MITVYLSHPFTGNEKTNRLRARTMAAQIARSCPDVYVYNPLDALQYAECAGLDYFRILQLCKELIRNCDALFLAGGWKHSNGCMMEKQYAEKIGLPVLTDIEQLTDWMAE